jgi:hypothetical protein
MHARPPFLLDTRPRRKLVRQALRILRAIEVENADLVPVVIPSKSGRRVVFLYLDDATFLTRAVDETKLPP